MSDTLTDNHHTWSSGFTGVDTRPKSSGGAGAGPTGSWSPPFDLPACDHTADATVNLVDIKAKLKEWDDAGFNNEMNLVRGAIDKQLSALSGPDRALTAAEAQLLTGLGLMAVQSTRDALAAIVAAISAELDNYSGVDAQAAIDAAAELLHKEFRAGDGSNRVADLKEMVSKTKDMTEQIKGYVEDAKQLKSIIKSAGKLEQVSTALEGFKAKLGKVAETLTLASDVATIAGKVNQKPSVTGNDIATMKAGLDIVGIVIDGAKIPGLGVLWNGYIKRCADICFALIQSAADSNDAGARGRAAEEWYGQASKGMRAPTIADSGLGPLQIADSFPGGQPMLDFMWSLFRGGPPSSAPGGVVKEFMKFRKQFNAGMSEEDQLQTDASWKNAWDAFGDENSPNLMNWVVKNKETVWAMQYGALPHP